MPTINGSGMSDAAFRAWCSEVQGSERYRFTDAARQRWRQDWERRWLGEHPEAWYAAEVERMRERAPA